MNSLNNWKSLTILVLLTLLSGCTKSPESSVKKFYYSVEKGEITEAKEYISAQMIGMMGESKLSVATQEQEQSDPKTKHF